MFWRPAHEIRGVHGYWWDSPSTKLVELQGLAAKLFYSHFNTVHEYALAENDRDGKRW